jgi:hypothetical protein
MIFSPRAGHIVPGYLPMNLYVNDY